MTDKEHIVSLYEFIVRMDAACIRSLIDAITKPDQEKIQRIKGMRLAIESIRKRVVDILTK